MKGKVPIICRTVTLMLLLTLLIPGCFQSLQVADERDSAAMIPWLVDGATTREEVVQNLPQSPYSLSNGKIVIYVLDFDEEKGLVDKFDGRYQLVLVFNERDIVIRHSVVRNR